MSKELIVKHNKLIEANYKLTLQEQKLILVLSSFIEKDDKKFKKCIFSVSELADLLNLNKKAYYSELKDVTEKLISRVIKIKETDGLLQMSWLSSAKYYDDAGKVELSFDEKLTPYLLQLSSHFTKLELKKLVSLNSVYAVRIYELLKQYENFGERTFEIDELKKILCIDKTEYKLYADFKRRALNAAEKEINEKTDLLVSFDEIKTGRKITTVRFNIEKKSNISSIGEVENIEVKNIEEVKEYPEEVLDLFNILPFGEQVEKRKAELAELLKSHTFEYLKKDIEYCNSQSPEKYWGYFIKSVNSGHYSSAELEKAKLKEQQKLKKKEQEEKLKKEQEEREQKLKMLIEKRFKELTDEELQEYENKYKALPNAVKRATAKEILIKEWIREEMKQATA